MIKTRGLVLKLPEDGTEMSKHAEVNIT
jgi:hypothetical protein